MNDVQSVALDIYKSVSQICDEEGFRYFAIAGTCIGAIRHNGFIPWDDDIDIAMPIEDYLRFIEIAGERLPEEYELYTFDNHPPYGNIFMKVCDKRTTFIEEKELGNPDAYKGIWIDIMPMSGIPSDKSQQKRFVRKAFFYDLWMTRLYQGFKCMDSWKAKIAWIVMRPFSLVVRKDPRELWFEMIKRYSFDDSAYTGYVWWGRCLSKLIFPIKWFEDYELLPFEDTTIRCPVGWHEYLTQHFGDYLQLPPESQRSVHSGFVDVENSYRRYQTGDLKVMIKG